jgi:serine phosphatase RsbU (regulator of sigma subunit)
MSADLLAWGVAGLALPGQAESGDLHVVAPFANGALVAVIDGLGHGGEAAAAARIAAATLLEHAHESVISLVRRCDQQLKATRGAVMSLASFNALDHTMTWLAVGNVEGFLVRGGAGPRAKEAVLQRGGVVGYSLPPLRADRVAVSPGDAVVLATDGIRSGFADGLSLEAPPQHLADRLLSHFYRGTDDALVLVARYEGIMA